MLPRLRNAFANTGTLKIACTGSKMLSSKRMNHASYNVANSFLEFSISIERTTLSPGYGDGFQGAPLQAPPIKPTQKHQT
jgi:hypothetical protein